MNSLTEVFKKKCFLGGLSKDEFIQKKIIPVLKNGKAKEAFVFGSFYTADFGCDSDFDLIIVKETPRKFHDRYLDFLPLFNLDVPLDILIYTPAEFQIICEEDPKVGFWKTVFQNLIKIF